MTDSAQPQEALIATPLVIAHRGASAAYPEQTRAAYLKAIEDGADGLECDVHLTKDNHLVCTHDDTVDRTSNGSGLVEDHTLAELRNLDWTSWKGVDIPEEYGTAGEQLLTLPELIEIIQEAPRPITLVIETKQPNPRGLELEDYLAQELNAIAWDSPETNLSREQIVIVSLFQPSLKKLQELGIDFEQYLLVFSPAFIEEHLSGLRASGADEKTIGFLTQQADLSLSSANAAEFGGVGADIAYLREDPNQLAQWRDSGQRLYFWSVENEKDLTDAVNAGAAVVATDHPLDIVNLLATHTASKE